MNGCGPVHVPGDAHARTDRGAPGQYVWYGRHGRYVRHGRRARLGPALLIALLAGAVGITGAARPARADERPVVAILPLSASTPRMQIYGAPVADALAKHLGTPGEVRVEAPSLDEVLPERVDLVIDGRIVEAGATAVRLEARVRDPERGLTLAEVATGARPLAQIDRLAEELARALDEPLRAAMSTKRRHQAAASVPATSRAPAGNAAQPGEAQPSTSPAEAAGSRAGAAAPMLIFDATGQAADGAVPVTDAATRASHALARRLGFRPMSPPASPATPEGKGDTRGDRWAPARVRAALASAGARHGLAIEVRDIHFTWKGVLLARGYLRVMLFDAEGQRVYDRIRRTGTLVGSRGDLHAALVGFVMEQATDMFAPDLARALRHQAALAQGRSGVR
jgi:hypothetical protein